MRLEHAFQPIVYSIQIGGSLKQTAAAYERRSFDRQTFDAFHWHYHWYQSDISGFKLNGTFLAENNMLNVKNEHQEDN